MTKVQPRLFDEETEVIDAEVYPRNASHPRAKAVIATDEHGHQTEYPSMNAAEKALGINPGGISKVCGNPKRTAGGYRFHLKNQVQAAQTVTGSIVEFTPSDVEIKTSSGMVVTGIDTEDAGSTITSVFEKMVRVDGGQAKAREHNGYIARAIIALGYFEDTNDGDWVRRGIVEHVWKPTAQFMKYCKYSVGKKSWTILDTQIPLMKSIHGVEFVNKVASIIECEEFILKNEELRKAIELNNLLARNTDKFIMENARNPGRGEKDTIRRQSKSDQINQGASNE